MKNRLTESCSVFHTASFICDDTLLWFLVLLVVMTTVLVKAVFTYATEIKPVSLDQSVKAFGCFRFNLWKIVTCHWQVNDSVAAVAHKMEVRAYVVIKMVNTQDSETVLCNDAGFRQLI